jgi:hypothetical protein
MICRESRRWSAGPSQGCRANDDDDDDDLEEAEVLRSSKCTFELNCDGAVEINFVFEGTHYRQLC